ncbi:MAG: flagellar filament outer layer protein FlaA [Spirochaetaceae bacterium]
MRRAVLFIIVAVAVTGIVFAQNNDTQPEDLGADTAQQALQEVSISRFEDPGFWKVYVPADQGVTTHQRMEGAPADKEPISEEEEADLVIQDEFVLGVKTEFFPPRQSSSIYIQASRPLAVPGIAKTLSVWVVGRNFNHRLSVVIRDFQGRMSVLNMGRLNFSGWRQLSAPIPPDIEQRDIHYSDQGGIEVIGFVIEPDLLETYGSYYVYFDDLRAQTDLFTEESRDPDDMVDSW